MKTFGLGLQTAQKMPPSFPRIVAAERLDRGSLSESWQFSDPLARWASLSTALDKWHR